MQDKLLFEYAVIRVVPMVEREEFMNVGVVVYCVAKRFLGVLFQIDEARLHALCSHIDMDELHTYLASFRNICEGRKDSGPVGKLPVADRFRWLTATRSTIVQTSKVHPGLCDDPADMLQKLYAQLVQKTDDC